MIAPPRKKPASDDAAELSLPSYVAPSHSRHKPDSCLGQVPPLQLYSSLQLAVDGEHGLLCLICNVNALRDVFFQTVGSYFANACKPAVQQLWRRAFCDMYNDFLSSIDCFNHEASSPKSFSNCSENLRPPLWLGTVPLPILYVAYAVLVEQGVAVTDDALLQVVVQPDVLFRGYQEVHIAAMKEHQYGMVQGAAAAAYADVFQRIAEAGALDYMLKADSTSATFDNDDGDRNGDYAWWCIPPDSDMSRGRDALMELVGQEHTQIVDEHC